MKTIKVLDGLKIKPEKNGMGIRADKLSVIVDKDAYAKALGAQLAGHVSKEIRGIKKTVKAETVERRMRHDKNRSTESYRRKYQGGRLGEKPPGAGNLNQWGYDSGRTADGISMKVRDGKGTLSTAANRINDHYFGKTGDRANYLRELRNQVPALAGKPSDRSGMKGFFILLAALAAAKEPIPNQRKLEGLGQLKKKVGGFRG